MNRNQDLKNKIQQWYSYQGIIAILTLGILAIGVIYFAKSKVVVKNIERICPSVIYGEYKNPQTGEVKNFAGCNAPEFGWEKVDTKPEIYSFEKQRQLREYQHKKEIESYQIQSKEEFEKLVKVYTGLPVPIEDHQVIQGYERVLVSHSGNSELYVLNTYSKSVEEVNEYAGGWGIKEVIYFECKKNTGNCQRSIIIEQAKEAKLQDYFSSSHSNAIDTCFQGWDAENERIYSQGCGLSWVYGFTQFNYGEHKYFFMANGGDNLKFLGINKQLNQYAIVENSKLSPSSTEKTFPTKILLYLTTNPTQPNKIIDVSGIVNSRIYYSSIESFSWNEDGNSANFTFQNRNYFLDAKAGTLK